jgi:hypothetical protein
MSFLDAHPSVVEWTSEPFGIPYWSPIDHGKPDRRRHRYYPDFWVKKKQADGTVAEMLIEIKPYKQTVKPEQPRMLTKRFLNEARTYGVNIAKWKAAEQYCNDRGWQFVVLTEKQLGIKF